jgi:hypothetical protein
LRDLQFLILLSSNDPPVPAFPSLFFLPRPKTCDSAPTARLFRRSELLIAPHGCRGKAKRRSTSNECPYRQSLSSCTLRQVLKAYARVTELSYGAIDVYGQSHESTGRYVRALRMSAWQNSSKQLSLYNQNREQCFSPTLMNCRGRQAKSSARVRAPHAAPLASDSTALNRSHL